MIVLDDNFMKEELDYFPITENNDALYKDYYYKICTYVGNNNVYKPLPSEVEEVVNKGRCKRICCNCILISKDERINLFKRAMGLQLLYDVSIGRNTMARGTNKEEDICRETKAILNTLGLLKEYGVVR